MLKSHFIMCDGHIMHLPFCYIIAVIQWEMTHVSLMGGMVPCICQKISFQSYQSIWMLPFVKYAPILLNSLSTVIFTKRTWNHQDGVSTMVSYHGENIETFNCFWLRWGPNLTFANLTFLRLNIATKRPYSIRWR
jgi:hypothetical protein